MSKHIIELSVRLRPLFTDEKPVISVKDGRKIVIQDKSFKYPSHIIEGKDQEIAYKALGERLVNALFEGYNCSLLAYGQTGSGKTYSMLGPPGSLTESALEQAPKDKNPHE